MNLQELIEWWRDHGPVRVADLGVQRRLFARRGVRMAQLTPQGW